MLLTWEIPVLIRMIVMMIHHQQVPPTVTMELHFSNSKFRKILHRRDSDQVIDPEEGIYILF